jgi:hypothetical protein
MKTTLLVLAEERCPACARIFTAYRRLTALAVRTSRVDVVARALLYCEREIADVFDAHWHQSCLAAIEHRRGSHKLCWHKGKVASKRRSR